AWSTDVQTSLSRRFASSRGCGAPWRCRRADISRLVRARCWRTRGRLQNPHASPQFDKPSVLDDSTLRLAGAVAQSRALPGSGSDTSRFDLALAASSRLVEPAVVDHASQLPGTDGRGPEHLPRSLVTGRPRTGVPPRPCARTGPGPVAP